MQRLRSQCRGTSRKWPSTEYCLVFTSNRVAAELRLATWPIRQAGDDGVGRASRAVGTRDGDKIAWQYRGGRQQGVGGRGGTGVGAGRRQREGFNPRLSSSRDGTAHP